MFSNKEAKPICFFYKLHYLELQKIRTHDVHDVHDVYDVFDYVDVYAIDIFSFVIL